MKILEINRWLAPGGAERFIVDLSNELAKIEGNEVCVCTYVKENLHQSSFYRTELNRNVQYVNLGGRLGTFAQIVNAVKVFLFILRWKPDVVHCHLSAFYMCFIPCLLMRNVKFVNTLHNVAEKNIKSGLEKKLKSFLYLHGMQAVTISPSCFKSFSEYMGFNNTVMISNGCRDIYRTILEQNAINEINALKKTNKTRMLVNVARLHPQKNHQLLVEAFEMLVSKGYDAVLLIIGSYDDFPDITFQIKSLIHSERVYLLGNKKNVTDYLYNCDAFCLSSKWEGAPISVLEAGFAGCFPICTPAGGCVDYIITDEWGFLAKDFSLKEYFKLLEKFMLMETIPRNKVSYLYKNKFGIKECASKYMEVFKSL